MTMKVQVLGAGLDVGRSCFLLTVANRQLLLDCGAHHGFADNRRFPDFPSLPPETLSNLDAILITHFHFDHAAALPFLACVHECKAPIYMTEPTLHLTRLMLQDFLSTAPSRCPFTETDVHSTLSRVKNLNLNAPIEVPPSPKNNNIDRNNDKITVTAFQAGHTLGAVMLHIRAGTQTILYSGDYSVRPDRVIPTASVPSRLRPHLFISEATYCSSVRSFNDDTDVAMTAAVFRTLSLRGKVLFPVSAFGRVHSLCASLSRLAGQFPLSEVPAYVVSGTTTKALDVYNRFSDWTVQSHNDSAERCIHCLTNLAKKKQKKEGDNGNEEDEDEDDEIVNNKQTGPRKRSRFTAPCSHGLLQNLRPFNRTQDWHVIDAPGPVILFATPANLSTGISRQVFQTWCTHPDNLVVMPSASFTTSVAANTFNASTALQNGASGPNVRCKIVNSLSACHPDSTDILRMIRHVDPKSVMLVHGEQNKVLSFRERVTDLFEIPCYAPENGESIEVPTDILSTTPVEEENDFKLPKALVELSQQQHDDPEDEDNLTTVTTKTESDSETVAKAIERPSDPSQNEVTPRTTL